MNFRKPVCFNDRHLLVFFVHIAVIALTTFLMLLFFYKGGFYAFAGKDSFFGNLSADFHALTEEIRSDAPLDKQLVTFKKLLNEDEIVRTDKFLDLSAGGMWMTYRQQVWFLALLMGMSLSAIIFMIGGIGWAYKPLQKVLAVVSLALLPLFVLVIPIGIWGVAFTLLSVVACAATIYLSPLLFPLELILGLIQIFVWCREKKFKS